MRQDIARGVHGFPEAADMMQLEWDDELAHHAQKSAELCNTGGRVAWAADFRDRDYSDKYADSSISWESMIQKRYSGVKTILDNPSPNKSVIDSFFKRDHENRFTLNY